MSSVYPEEWLEEDNIMLIECWARDGYSYSDIANRIGISSSTLSKWKATYPEIEKALRRGREIVDYKVENALLKSALGYRAKETRITSTIREGKLVETVKETIHREQAPNVSAIQVWLYNRLPDKWKKNRDSLIEIDDEESKIQVTVTRASKSELEEDGIELNESIELRSKPKDEIDKIEENDSKVEKSDSNVDLDYWPDDWEDYES